MKNLTINCNDIQISNDKQICLIAGPCQLETEQHALDMAGKIGEIAKKHNLGFVYKTSFDKANRTSLKGKRGAGLENSLPIFDNMKQARNLALARMNFIKQTDSSGKILITKPNGEVCECLTWGPNWTQTMAYVNCKGEAWKH